LLVQHFLLQLTSDIRDQKIFSPEALEILAQQSWPGNIRQLNNVVQQCVAMATGNVISAAQVRDALGEQQLHHASFNDARDEFTRHYLVQLLKFTEGNVSQAARLADRNRTDFHKLLKKHNVDSGEFKS
ncbi:MAG TPA: two-component system response regulator GlrR, partial [Pseudomonadales bacterium]|nr:two-component system response regulator GlrR [Pseudomonadales bacterium]